MMEKLLIFTLRETGTSLFGISGSKISKVLDLIDVGCLTLLVHVNKQNVYLTMSHLGTCITNVYQWL